jgi:nucleoside-diphosphate-sugar epimerase
MKIVVTGNMGYVGPAVVRRLRASHPEALLVGVDTAFFGHCLTGADVLPESNVDVQYLADVRTVSRDVFEGADAVVHLAAVSNDPMGNAFEEVTIAINQQATLRVADLAKESGARSFVFASSCSVYGHADEKSRTESSPVNPLTAYARSKIGAETALEGKAEGGFHVTCLRFATACGMSDRLRLDLVLNDFVASAVASGRIKILSDGSPWRPLIHVNDMAKAIDWAIVRERGGPFVLVNVGSDDWNVRVRELAEAVQTEMPDVEIEVNRAAAPDTRSYRVDFGLYRELAPDHLPEYGISRAVRDLRGGLEKMGFADREFRGSSLMRLNVLSGLRKSGLLDEQLRWTRRSGAEEAR